MKERKKRMMEWERVVQYTRSLSQDTLEVFWDELVILADPRWDSVPEWAVEEALQAARTEDGQGVVEYVALIGLVAIIIFIIVTWLFGSGSGDSGALDQLRTAIAQMFP